MEQTIKKISSQLEKKIAKRFPRMPSEHDFYHSRRVLNTALKLQKKHGGDRLVIAVASILHDVHRLMRVPGKKYVTPGQSLPVVKKLLQGINLPPDKILKILRCVENHEQYSFTPDGQKAKDIETQIIQDADNLDAIGAISIARVFYWGGVHSTPIWIPGTPLGRIHYSEEEEVDRSQVEHFYSKILKLKDDMNTTTARKIALKRHKFTEDYLKQFFLEWDGKV